MAGACQGRGRLAVWIGLLVGIWSWSILAWASGASLGERDFVRTTSTPVVETVRFEGTAAARYVLTVYNTGRRHQFDPVTAAVIALNGVTVFGPDDFKQQVPLLQRTVSLAADNQLAVELRSKPKSGLTIVLEPVAEAQHPPHFESTPGLTAQEDTPYVYQVRASDPDGDTLAYSLITAPEGLQIDAETGAVTWIPRNDQVGPQPVAIVVRDSAGLLDTQEFTVLVSNTNDVPVITSTPGTSVQQDQPYQYQVLVEDIDLGDTVTFQLVSGPQGMQLDPASGALTWLPGNADVGSYPVVIRAVDASGAAVEQSFALTVVNVNDVPVITSFPELQATEEAPYRYAVQAFDPDQGDALSYWLEIAPTGMHIDTVAGVITWTPENSQVGSAEVRLVVRDSAGAEVAQSFTLGVQNVNDVPVFTSQPSTQASEKALYTYSLQAADEDAGDTLQFALFEGPSGMQLDAQGILSWTPDKFQGGQSYPVTVTVQDLAGAEARQSFVVEVANVNVAPVITSVPAVTTLQPGDLFSYGVVATDADGDTLQFSLVEGPAGMSVEPSTGLVQWLAAGINTAVTASLRVTDGQGGEAIQALSLSVSERNLPPVITSTAVQSVQDGQSYGYQVTASDPNPGDVVRFGLLMAPEGMSIDPVTGLVSWTPRDLPPVLPTLAGETCLPVGASFSSTFSPVVKWVWPRNTASLPIVAPVRDTNGDGRYDENDTPTVIALNGSYHNAYPGRLFALDGKTGKEVMEFVVPDSVKALAGGVRADSHLAVGDLEGDGKPDIVGYASSSGGRIIAFNNDGSFKWLSAAGVPPASTDRQAGVQIMDLDHDGKAEIIANEVVLNFDGTLRFRTAAGWSSAMPIAADIDLDGNAEVVIGNIAYRQNGTVLWDKTADGGVNGLLAVGNIDDDPYPEIVSVSLRNSIYEQGHVDVRNHDGSLKWRKLLLLEAGVPSIADLDNDGRAEIIIGAGQYYRVFTGDGVEKLAVPAHDDSKIAGSSIFDFDNDGTGEIVFNDSNNFVIADGRTGVIKSSVPRGSLTGTEYPTVADVDGDGHADILVQTGGNWSGAPSGAFVVYSNVDNNWAPARKLWNQHGYNPQMVADNLRSLTNAPTYFQRDNSMRQQTYAWTPDLAVAVAGLARVEDGYVVSVSVTNRSAGANSRAATLVLRGDQDGSPTLATASVDLLAAGDTATLQLPVVPSALQGQRLRVEVLASGADCHQENNVARFVVAGVEARDGGGLTDEQYLAVSATAVNRAPVLDAQTLPAAYGGGTYNFQLLASDPDTIDRVEFKLVSAPKGLYLTRKGLLYGRTESTAAGTFVVNLQLKDLNGGVSDYQLPLTIIANHAPVISSKPIPEANGEVTAYTRAGHYYQIVASDPDGDPLTYSYRIVARRIGSVATSGTTSMVTWARPYIVDYPQWVDDYDVYIDVKDNRGFGTTQTYFLRVKPSHVPYFISKPPTTAVPGVPYVYDIEVDPPQYSDESYTWNLWMYPAGMIWQDPGLGKQYRRVVWTPTAAQIGARNASLTLYTSDRASVNQSWTVNVVAGTPPSFQSQPPTTAKVGRTWSYQMVVADPDGQKLTYSLVSGPSGMTVSSTGFVTWLPGSAQVGSQAVKVRVSDGVFTVDQLFTLDVLSQSVPLTALVSATPDRVDPGQSVAITLSATGAGSPVTYQLKVNGQSQPVGSNGKATFTPTAPGIYSILAIVNDGYDTAQASTSLYVRDPNDTTPPVALISAPVDDAELALPVAVTGTVTDTALEEYRLYLQPVGSTDYVLLARGTAPVSNGVLGRLDPTQLENGLYRLVLMARDLSGQETVANATVEVTGEAKVGTFQLAFRDVNIEAMGLPITVTRRYDTRRKFENLDFGYGWSVDYRAGRVQKNMTTGAQWSISREGPLLMNFCLRPIGKRTVMVALPDGKLHRFDVRMSPECETGQAPQGVTPVFIPRPGTTSTLAAEDVGALLVQGGTVYDPSTGLPYSPTRFTLTTQEGFQYGVQEGVGVLWAKDAHGNTLTYTANGVQHSNGQGVQFIRNSDGRIGEVVDPAGHRLRYGYDSSGNLLSVTDASGAVSELTYDASHALRTYTDPRHVLVLRNDYDAEGRLVAQYDAGGQARTLAHDLAQNVEVLTDRLGRSTRYEFDAMGNIVRQVDAAGGVTATTYDAYGNELTVTDPLGRTTTQTYWRDSDKVLTRADALGNVTAFTYDGNGNQTSTRDARGHYTLNSFDGYDLKAMTDAEGGQSSFYYDYQGNLVTLYDAAGLQTVNGYDARGNRTSESNSGGQAFSYTFDANNRELTRSEKRTTAGGVVTLTWTREYDARGNVVKVTDPLGGVETTEYDVIGKVAARTDRRGQRTEYAYDNNGRLVLTRYADGSTETVGYDAEGNKVRETDRGGRETRYEYDALNRLVKTVAATGDTQTSTYDAAGQLVASTDARGRTTTYAYDAAGRQTAVTDAQGRTTSYTHDANGNVLTMTDARGRVTRYEYDKVNRRVATILPGGQRRTVTYDALGRKRSETLPSGRTVRYGYDVLGRLTSVTDHLNQVTRYSYDEAGNKLSQTDARGQVTRWSYDALNRVTSRTLPDGTRETYAYDDAATGGQ